MLINCLTKKSRWTEITVVVIAQIDLRTISSEPIALTLAADDRGKNEEEREKYQEFVNHMFSWTCSTSEGGETRDGGRGTH